MNFYDHHKGKFEMRLGGGHHNRKLDSRLGSMIWCVKEIDL